jgi:hypothetical protein
LQSANDAPGPSSVRFPTGGHIPTFRVRRLGWMLPLLLAACGEEARPDPAPAALAALREAVSSGRGLGDPAFPELVGRAATDLWPGSGPTDVASQAARKSHTDLSNIAGDVAREIASGAEARAAAVERDPGSVEIHDAFLAASAGAVPAYRTWVETEGAALLRKRVEAILGAAGPPPSGR